MQRPPAPLPASGCDQQGGQAGWGGGGRQTQKGLGRGQTRLQGLLGHDKEFSFTHGVRCGQTNSKPHSADWVELSRKAVAVRMKNFLNVHFSTVDSFLHIFLKEK